MRMAFVAEFACVPREDAGWTDEPDFISREKR